MGSRRPPAEVDEDEEPSADRRADEPDDLDSSARRLIDPATIPVRFSRLKAMSRSALAYLDACQDDSEDTLARRLGSGAHALLLGNPAVKWTERTKKGDKIAPRNGAAWVAFKAANAGAAVILTPKEWRAAERMADAVKSHRLARSLIEGAQLERAILWPHELGEGDGRACSSRLDIYRPGELVADFKTAREIQPGRFAHAVKWSHYHAQIAFYREAARRGLGDRAALDGWIIAVENTPPHDVVCYRLKPDALADGANLCDAWMQRVLACEADRVWPDTHPHRHSVRMTLGNALTAAGYFSTNTGRSYCLVSRVSSSAPRSSPPRGSP